jgi:hypothetical protein
MTLDDIRKKFPSLGLCVYAIDPGAVTLEVIDGEQVYRFDGASETEVLAKAFPPPEPAPNVFD